MVQDSGLSLLGRDWLMKIRLDWLNRLSASTALEDVLEWQAGLFNIELCTLKGVKVSLSVKPAAQPRFCKARYVPFLFKDKIESELARLQEAGIFKLVQFFKRAGWV